MKYWRLFAKKTTIHGLRFLAKENRITRVVWLFVVAISLTLCLWSSDVNTREYLRYDVRISTTYTTATELQFPAITLWNSNLIRRTVIGRRIETKFLVSRQFGADLAKVDRTCDYKPKVRDDIDDTIDMLLEKFVKLAGANVISQDFVDLVAKLVLVNREMTFVKCWMKRVQVNCSTVVLNTVISDTLSITPSFSVNLHPDRAKTFINKNILGVSFKNEAYNPVEDMTVERDNFGVESGYRFLLNVNTDEYCIQTHESRIWYGVGLHATFHDHQILNDQADGEGTVYLQPGYQYNVLVEPIKYTRLTEHLGYCISRSNMYLFQTDVYNRKMCQVQCIFETQWKYCNCTTAKLGHMKNIFAKHHGLNDSEVAWCYDNALKSSCIYDGLFHNGELLFDKFCSHCKRSCEEIAYKFQVTADRFPPQHLYKYYHGILNLNTSTSNDDAIGKNYIMLNVFFGSRSVNVIQETQMYTIRDLFISLGNNAILFLGMSFMSFYETVHLIVHLSQLAIVQCIFNKTNSRWALKSKKNKKVKRDGNHDRYVVETSL